MEAGKGGTLGVGEAPSQRFALLHLQAPHSRKGTKGRGRREDGGGEESSPG